MRKIPRNRSMIKPDDKGYDYEAIAHGGTWVKGFTLGTSVEEVEKDLAKHQYLVCKVLEIMNNEELISYAKRITYF